MAASETASATTVEFSASIEEINASVEESASGASELQTVVKKLNDQIKSDQSITNRENPARNAETHDSSSSTTSEVLSS